MASGGMDAPADMNDLRADFVR